MIFKCGQSFWLVYLLLYQNTRAYSIIAQRPYCWQTMCHTPIYATGNSCGVTEILKVPKCSFHLYCTKLPIIHVHIPNNPCVFAGEVNANVLVTASSIGTPRGEGPDHQYALYLDANNPGSDSDHKDSQNLHTMLEVLYAWYPACDFCQYKNQLQAHGIRHLVTAGMLMPHSILARLAWARVQLSCSVSWLWETSPLPLKLRGIGGPRERRGPMLCLLLTRSRTSHL